MVVSQARPPLQLPGPRIHHTVCYEHYLRTLCATDREVFSVVKIVFVADSVSAWTKVVAWSVVASTLLHSYDES
jgi:hypothetical protein